MTAVYEFLQYRMARLLSSLAIRMQRGNGGAGQRAPVPLSRVAARHMAAPIAMRDHVKASSTCRPLV
eukprot:2266727-Pleurochrysis_carterae.AAC.5